LLAAPRLDDRTAAQSAALAAHLASCEACRSVETSFRQVGAFVRHLPTLVPPPSLRASVFAAITAEREQLAARQLKHESPAARLARAETDPGLPVVRALPVARLPERRARLGVPAVAAIAAVFLVALLGAGLAGGPGFSSVAAALGGVFGRGDAGPRITRYTPNSEYSLAVGALATGGWLVYGARNAGGEAMLFARDRHTRRESALLGAPTRDDLVRRALTERWVVWSDGRNDVSADWALRASRLPDGSGHVATPLTLARNANTGGDSAGDAPTMLTGVWARGETVLLSALTRDGGSVLVGLDLSSGQPAARVIARPSASGRLLTDPSRVGNSYYWAEVWVGQDARLHSEIWLGDGNGHARALSGDEAAFAPHATGGTLLWIEARDVSATGVSARDLAGNARALAGLRGDLEARDLASGQQWRLTAGAEAGTLQAAGAYVLWHAGQAEHTYDLRAHGPSGVESEIRGAAFAGADEAALSWGGGTAGGIAVLDQ
jgi:hypothetical protein